MTLRYTISENDYLQYLLYTSSNNKLTKTGTFKMRLGFYLFYLFVILAFLKKELYDFAVLFGILILIEILIYPGREKKVKFNYLRRVAQETESLRLDKNYEATFNYEQSYITVFNYFGKSDKILRGNETIVELEKYFYVLFTNDFLIIPKSQVDNEEILREIFTTYAREYKIEFKTDFKFKW